jgi:hypothetical protein
MANAFAQQQLDLIALLRGAIHHPFLAHQLAVASSTAAPVSSVLTMATPQCPIKVEVTDGSMSDALTKVTTDVAEAMASSSSTAVSSPSPTNSSTTGDDRASPASTVGSLPKESEHAERKRPAAIQELLQMKKARLSCTTEEKKPMPSVTADKSPTEILDSNVHSNSGPLSEIIDRLCNSQDQDSETASSASSKTPSKKKNRSKGSSNPSSTVTPTNANMSVSDTKDLLGSFNDGAALMMALKQSVALKQAAAMVNATPMGLPQNNGTPERLPSRTNDSDVYESPISTLVPHDKIFALVPGRLSLLSNVVKYKMTVGEVRRRIMGPESFNFSLLGALLRRAKMPEKSQALVDELEQVGLSIPRGRRRASNVTLLSALTESESVQFARDFQKTADSEFPCVPLAEQAHKTYRTHLQNAVVAELYAAKMNSDEAMERSHLQRMLEGRLSQLEATRDMVNEFVELLKQDRSPVMDSNPESILDRRIQDPLSTFSMLTHGFGTPAVLVGMQMFNSFTNHQIELIVEQQKQLRRNN